MATTEHEDGNLYAGISPAYGWYEDANQWRKLRCDSAGNLLVSTALTNGDVRTPSTTAEAIHNGPAEVVAVTNTTATVITILDGATPVAVVPSLSVLTAPIFVTTSLAIQAATAALGKQTTVIWRAR